MRKINYQYKFTPMKNMLIKLKKVVDTKNESRDDVKAVIKEFVPTFIDLEE